MRILAINGSHRGENGYTQFLIDKLAWGVEEAGAQFETVVLSKLKINRCLGCMQCQTERSYLKCIFEEKDDIKKIQCKMMKADIIVYATPVYVFGMSSLLKIFLERFMATADSNQLRLSDSGRIFHHINHDLGSKPFVPLICCDNVEDEISNNIISYFKIFSKFMDAPVVGTLVRNMGQSVGHGKAPELEQKFPIIFDVYDAFQLAGKELATLRRIQSSTQKRTNQLIIDMSVIQKLLFKLNLKPVKKKALEQAQKMMQTMTEISKAEDGKNI